MKRVTIALSVGCPCGVGPEIAVLAAARSRSARCVLVGDEAVVRRAARIRRVAQRAIVPVGGARSIASLAPGEVGLFTGSTPMQTAPAFGEPDAEAGAAQLAWINEATELVRSRTADALVTGPASKHAIATSGAPGSKDFLGHTEHLARVLKARGVVMAFWSPELCVSLVTTHIPLSAVPGAVTPEGVAMSAYRLTHLLRDLGLQRPSIAVCAMNPHAGEGGLLGTEEGERILPGIVRARRRLAREGTAAELHGPLGAESAIRRAASGGFDGVVAMYHDQATIPCKLTSFGDAVNVTLGLPIIRTSVDHGTAYDLAGTGRSDARAMKAAIDLALKLSTRAASKR